MRIRFHPAARRELTEVAQYYDRESPGIGKSFVREAERAINTLAERPRLGVPMQNNRLRQWPLRRFPYYLIYVLEGDDLIVLAVAHQKRRPGYWEGRD
jgi:plasmid stabilization system protein ParE